MRYIDIAMLQFALISLGMKINNPYGDYDWPLNDIVLDACKLILTETK